MPGLFLSTILFAAVLSLPIEEGRPLVVECPMGQSTRVVFPEALHALKVPGPAKAQLGLSVEQSAPVGIVTVRPSVAGAEGLLEFRGPTLTVLVRLKTTARGAGGEVRLERVLAPPVPPALSTATPHATSTPEPPPVTPSPAPAPSATPPIPASAPGPEVSELLQAQVVPVGRREGLPGEHEMVLVDALKGRTSLWLRFQLDGGAGARVEEVRWEQGSLTDVVQEPTGKDLRVVVAIPREGITKRSLIALRCGGRTYEFSFSNAAFRALHKALER